MHSRTETAKGPRAFIAGAWQMFRSVFDYAELVKALIKRDIRARYRGSVLGLLWSFITPLVLLLTYSLVFSVFFKMRWTGADWPGAFIVMLFCGLIPFNFFSESLGRAPSLIVSSPNYVKRVAFPVQILPVVSTGGILFHTLISLGLLLAAILIFQGKLPLSALYMPLIWVPLILFTLALSLAAAGLGVFLRDVAHSIGLLLNVLFFLTPVFYPDSLVPVRLHFLLWFNPLAYAAANIRKTCVLGEPLNLASWGVMMLASLFLLFLVCGWFASVRRRFADVL